MYTLLLLTGCLTDPDTYAARRAALTDDDRDGWTEDAGDCDDVDAGVYPGAEERCDGRDENCADGVADEVGASWYADADGDGFGAGDAVVGCAPPEVSGWVDAGGDCDDARASVNPDAAEVCGDGVDQDCDPGGCRWEGVVEGEGVASSLGYDADSVHGAAAIGFDFNGDRFDDFVVTIPREGARLYAGGPRATTVVEPTWTLPNDGGGERDGVVALLGDVSGDGLGDVALVTANSGGAGVEVWCGISGFSGPASAPCSDVDTSAMASHIAGIGRTAIGERTWMYSIQQDDGSSIVYANDGLQASESAAEIRAAAGMSGVLQVAAMGDLDGDGFDEVAVTGLAEDLRGTTYIVSGSDWGEFSNLSDVETVILGEVDGAMSAFVAGNADFDGDGRADVLRGTPNLYAGLPGFAEVYVGGVPRQSSEPWLKIAAQAVGDAFGVGVSFADLDGDGAVDVAIGAPLRVGTAPGDGAVTFLYGPYSGTVDAELLPTIMGPTPDGTFGEAVLACQLDSLSANELLVLGEGGAHLIAGKGE